MKFLAVELTDDNLSLLARDSSENVVWKKAGGGERVDIPLPPELCGRVLAMPEETARFIAASMKQVGFFQRSVSLILDTEQVISAAFSHQPAPASKMPAIAELFAQSSLPGSPGNYYISYAVRGHVHPDGQLRSTLFGAEAAKLRGLYRALRRAGIDVFSIEPSSAAFARNAVSSERSRAGRGAGIYLDFGFSSSLVCACRDGQIVFEQSFSSVFSDLIEIYTETTGLTRDEFFAFLSRDGLDPSAEIYSRFPGFYGRVTALVDTALAEIFRTLRLLSSAERLEAGALTLSGDFTAVPGFSDRVLSGGTDFVSDDFEENYQLSKNLRLRGTPDPRSKNTENLLNPYFSTKRTLASSAAVAISLALLMLLVMPLQYLIFNRENAELENLRNRLAQERYTEIQILQLRLNSLTNSLDGLDSVLEKIPRDNPSMAKEKLEALHSVFSGRVTALQMNINNENSRVVLNFRVESLEDFLALKADAEATGYFAVLIPLSSAKSGEDGSWSGTITLAILPSK